MIEKQKYFLENPEAKIKAEPLNSNVLKILVSKKGERSEIEKLKKKTFLESQKDIEGKWSINGSPEKFSIFKEGLKITEFKDAKFSLPEWVKSKEGLGSWTSIHHQVTEKSKIFGLGEKTGYLEKSGSRYEMWNTNPGGFYTHNQDPLYLSIPFYITTEGEDGEILGVYLDKPELSEFGVKYQRDPDSIGIAVNDVNLTFYLILGDNFKDVLREYTALTGKPFMPPKWALGYHQSKYGNPKDEKETIDLAQKFREKKIPCDALYFDIQYMNGYRIFTWNEEKFPNPEGMIEKLHDMGYKVVTIIDPGVKAEEGYAVYDSGLEKDVFVRAEEDGYYKGVAWPGFCVFPDFLREGVRDWWADQHKLLLSQGIDGIWNDMNEPAIFFGKKQIKKITSNIQNKISSGAGMSADDLQELRSTLQEGPWGLIHEDDEENKISHEKVHNVYALYEADATSRAFEKYMPKKRPFILTRAGFSGIQKYAITWTGDNSSTWEHMKMSIFMVLNLGLSGIPFAGADIGGFHGDADPELLTRWIQLGAVLPFFRNHSTKDTVAQEPWSFGEPFEEINRKYIRLRYELLPYLYTLCYEAHKTGTPIVRPLFMEFPDDRKSYLIQDEFMLGDALLVSPILERGIEKTLVYLPYQDERGPLKWENWWTGEILESGHHIVDSPLDIMPLFIREDSGIPLSNPIICTEEKPKNLILRGNLENEIRIPIYHDDGKTRNHKNGEYFFGEFTIERNDRTAKVSLNVKNKGYEPFWENVELKMRINGEEVETTKIDRISRKDLFL